MAESRLKSMLWSERRLGNSPLQGEIFLPIHKVQGIRHKAQGRNERPQSDLRSVPLDAKLEEHYVCGQGNVLQSLKTESNTQGIGRRRKGKGTNWGQREEIIDITKNGISDNFCSAQMLPKFSPRWERR